ncbi:type 4a pilus biogenesis protein PilO [Ferrimonas aestuarii]|uniref:Uncharacterized protein n=1 Tax=Ferrimonas aestuarii TaxID=2569539 RepID=A0A4U1BLH9_9GAMM|nr:type 4a pilus biogenesis protein PilO [Ferrimonas aestuarii]TKB53949.1 hypothetical protein FCL42_13415 [Ferrimonas aestuarii]
MSLLENKPLLYTLIGSLAFCRFVAVPVFEWQQQQLNDISSLQSRLQKSAVLAENATSYETSVTELKAANEQMASSFVAAGEALPSQLSVQKQLESIAKRNGVDLRSINWLPVRSENGVNLLTAKLVIRGKSSDVIGMHLDLSRFSKVSEIVKFELQMRSWSGGSGTKMNAEIDMVIYQLQEAA